MNIHCEDCLEYMKRTESNSIDFIVTDPPYGIGWKGKKWDKDLPENKIWQEALRICKPGSMLAAFGHSRTSHRLAIAIEEAGWEIRDTIMWIYGSGFPKSNNHIGLDGYGTALKPAHEPIIVAMKPLDGTFKQNAEKWGQAGINIDDCRIGTDDTRSKCSLTALGQNSGWNNHKNKEVIGGSQNGRWPANVIFDDEAGAMLDKQSGWSKTNSGIRNNNGNQTTFVLKKLICDVQHADSGGASRFFYCAKPSPKEREGNTHPTVKPIALMKYIIKLLAPPNDPLLLDPFCGSGTTLIAAQELGIRAIGIDKEQEYVNIANERLNKNVDLFSYNN